MIQANELRIGNIIEYNGMYLHVSEIYSPKPRKPKRFDGVECLELLCDGFITVTVDEVNPIPLTEDILLKCGFRYKGSGFYQFEITDWANIQIHFYKGSPISEISIQKHSIVIFLGHIHQLQNLILLLTGKELEVNL